jgi:hypothetical protein
MRIAIRGGPAGVTEQRLRLGLSRYAPCITALRFELDGEACRLTVQLVGGGRVSVEDADPELTLLVDRACSRAARSIERSLRLLR